jgi:hypothetical protein
VFKINGVKVEVTGNLKAKLNNEWASFSKRLKSLRTVEVDGVSFSRL